MDAERRRKERAALDELDVLSSEDGGHELPQVEAASVVCATRQRYKRNRLAVLQATAQRIQQLEQLLNSAELAKHMAEAQARALSMEVGSKAVRARQRVQWLGSARTLDGAGLLSDHMARTLFDARSGQLLDASSSFFAMTGFTPGGLLQHDCPVPAADASKRPVTDSDDLLDSAQASVSSSDGRRGAVGSEQWTMSKPVKQYPRTTALIKRMMAGQLDSFQAPMRCRWVSEQLTYAHTLRN